MSFSSDRYHTLWLVALSIASVIVFSLSSVTGQSPADGSILVDNARTDNQIRLKAADNALVGYDQSNHFKKKLLEFVAPVYYQPLLHSGLV